MTTNDLQALSDREIAKRASEAQQHIDDAQAECDARAKAAAEAAAGFESSPSAEAHAQSAVAAQLAKNAIAKVTQLQEHATAVLAEQARRKRIARLAELRRIMDVPGTLRATCQRIETIMSEFETTMRSELTALSRALADDAALSLERSELERLHGDGGQYRPTEFRRALERVAELLAQRHFDAVEAQPTMRLSGGDRRVQAQIRIDL